MSYEVTRYHDFSAGHRVVGHEGKCRFLHGHNYRVHFTCIAADLDKLGRVIDFGAIKVLLCEWLESTWDHKMLIWDEDPMLDHFTVDNNQLCNDSLSDTFRQSIVKVPFNPTAENMAQYLVEIVGPLQLRLTNCRLISVTIDETRKCSATYTTPGMRGNIS